MSGTDNSFDAPTTSSEDTRALTPAELLHEKNDDPSNVIEQQMFKEQSLKKLASVLETLDARSRDILKTRWLEGGTTTTGELARRYKITAERIKQIEESAIVKLRAQLLPV